MRYAVCIMLHMVYTVYIYVVVFVLSKNLLSSAAEVRFYTFYTFYPGLGLGGRGFDPHTLAISLPISNII
jgi:hypothetical protein